jgi:hypothetical protein
MNLRHQLRARHAADDVGAGNACDTLLKTAAKVAALDKDTSANNDHKDRFAREAVAGEAIHATPQRRVDDRR